MVEAKVTIAPGLHAKASPKNQPEKVKEEPCTATVGLTTSSHWEPKITEPWAPLLHFSPTRFSQAGVKASEKLYLAVPGRVQLYLQLHRVINKYKMFS